MVLSGIFTAAFGFGYYMGIHSIVYYIFMQVMSAIHNFAMRILKFLRINYLRIFRL
jgi:hypothetical protein